MRFRKIAIHSRSPDAAARFYADRLGLQATGNGVQIGTTAVQFREGTPPGPYHLAVNIPSNQVRAAHAWVSTRAPMLSDDVFDFDVWEAEAVYFEDPDGNVLELIARRTLDNAVDADFGPELLLEVSELGLPAEDPTGTVDLLERALGIRVYSGDRVSFTAMGDEHGLFIVVPTGRAWLPTERAAINAPADVVVDAPTAGSVSVGRVRVTSRRGTDRPRGIPDV